MGKIDFPISRDKSMNCISQNKFGFLTISPTDLLEMASFPLADGQGSKISGSMTSDIRSGLD